jgi:hypothetical protein
MEERSGLLRAVPRTLFFPFAF